MFMYIIYQLSLFATIHSTVKVSAATFNKLVEKLTAPKDHGKE